MLDMKMDAMVRQMNDEDVIKKFKKEKLWGLCTSVDLGDCNPETIRDPVKLKEFILKICDFIEMKRFGEPTVVHFGANERVAGYSLIQLIETSCISGHFANETNTAYLDIFSCKEYPPQVAAEFCRQFFGAKRMKYTITFRV
jgi:S-adenosylmethionine/arginine decarboxylase-like enzyme